MIEATTALFDFPLVRYVRDVTESKRLNALNGPAVIIAASGMAESGRILHHLANHLGEPQSMVLFVGFQAEHTLGRRIQEGRKTVRVFGEDVAVRCESTSAAIRPTPTATSSATGYGASAARCAAPSSSMVKPTHRRPWRRS
jgi:predicted metal-dependent RNase